MNNISATFTATRQPISSPTAQTSGNGLPHLVKTLTSWLRAGSEPRVTIITDREGQTWWRAYNPRTRQLQWLTSETEALMWLEDQ